MSKIIIEDKLSNWIRISIYLEQLEELATPYLAWKHKPKAQPLDALVGPEIPILQQSEDKWEYITQATKLWISACALWKPQLL